MTPNDQESREIAGIKANATLFGHAMVGKLEGTSLFYPGSKDDLWIMRTADAKHQSMR